MFIYLILFIIITFIITFLYVFGAVIGIGDVTIIFISDSYDINVENLHYVISIMLWL